MKDRECVEFMQWALPTLRMKWRGFRKVRGQVCKRISRRFKELGLKDFSAYRSYLEKNRSEWIVLDRFCRITISRFYRDRRVFEYLGNEVMVQIGKKITAGDEMEFRAWSIGCASGEEPYTLMMVWMLNTQKFLPSVRFRIVATDFDRDMLDRARESLYSASSLKELPREWLTNAFTSTGDMWHLKREYRGNVEFIKQDIRTEALDSSFHIIMCRNLVFTYFDDSLQREILLKMVERLVPGGAIVIGKHESLPEGFPGLEVWSKAHGIFRKVKF